MTRIFLLLACMAFMAFGQETDEAVLKSRIRARAGTVRRLLASGAALETKGGLLRTEAGATAADQPVIKAENADRQAVWELVAQRTRTTPQKVKELFAERALIRNPKTPPVAGCGPAGNPDQLTRLVTYLYQGLRYAQQKQFENAHKEFEAMLGLDASFLSAHLNSGTALLRLSRFDEARQAYDAELKLTACLEPLPEERLAAYCYMLESRHGTPQLTQVLGNCRARVKETRQQTLVSLAGLHSLRKQKELSLAALRTAREAGFHDWPSLARDPDLAFVRTQPEFSEFTK